MDYKEMAAKASAFSDANRLKIMCMIAKKETCACNILEYIGITQPTLSYHMKLLTESGLVRARREGKWTLYSLVGEEFEKFASSVNEIAICDIEGLPDLDCMSDECAAKMDEQSVAEEME